MRGNGPFTHTSGRYNNRMDSPAPSLRLLDQVRQQARYRHYSLRTEEAYVYWVRFFVRWSGLRHPRDMGVTEVRAFLTMLATERRVSASTHNQALSALLFLYRQVLGIDLPWMQELQRPSAARRIPAVLTPDETAALLSHMKGTIAVVARLLYGTGMRLMEALRLRTKDVDFARRDTEHVRVDHGGAHVAVAQQASPTSGPLAGTWLPAREGLPHPPDPSGDRHSRLRARWPVARVETFPARSAASRPGPSRPWPRGR